MLDLIMAVFSGGMTGILGSAISGIFKFLEMREARKEKAADREHELKLQEIQMQAYAQETERELAIATQKAETAQMRASYRHDSEAGQGSQWVVDTLRMVRPVITVLSWVMVAVIWATLNRDFIDQATQQEVVKYLIITTVYTASAATLWWFGDRGRAFKGAK